MKNIKFMMLAILFTISIGCVSNQTYAPMSIGGIYAHNETAQTELYSRVSQWAAMNFASSNDVIQLADPTNGIIIIKARSTFKEFTGYERPFKFTMRILIKNNKIKIEFSNMAYFYSLNNGITWQTKPLNGQGFAKTPTKLANRMLKKLELGLNEYVRKYSNNNSW
jgi:hypothetical protein